MALYCKRDINTRESQQQDNLIPFYQMYQVELISVLQLNEDISYFPFIELFSVTVW